MKTLIACSLAFLSFALVQTSTAQGIKWHPGHYMLLNAGNAPWHFMYIDEIAKDSVIKGIHVRVWWYELEQSKGVYNFSRVDAYLKKLKSLPVPKRLVIRIMDRRFNTTNRANIVPSYLLSDSLYKGGIVRTKTGYAARIWEQPVMDRLIALYRAMGKRYDADPYLEGIATEETTLSLNSSNLPAGYSAAALAGQYVRLINSVRPVMPETNLFLGTNWLGSTRIMAGLMQDLVEPQVAAGGPDVMPNSMTDGQKVWTGGLGADYRGIVAIGNSVECSELGGKLGNYTPKQINDFAYNKLRVNYLFWDRNTSFGNSAQRWTTGILPFLRTNPPIRTNCPSTYGLCAR